MKITQHAKNLAAEVYKTNKQLYLYQGKSPAVAKMLARNDSVLVIMTTMNVLTGATKETLNELKNIKSEYQNK